MEKILCVGWLGDNVFVTLWKLFDYNVGSMEACKWKLENEIMGHLR